MAVTATQVGRDSVVGEHFVRDYDLVFSGTYATGGEAVTPATFKLRGIRRVLMHGGVAAAADLVTAIPVFYNYATSKFTFYEDNLVAASAALTEKTNAEAYPTGCKLRVTVYGDPT